MAQIRRLLRCCVQSTAPQELARYDNHIYCMEAPIHAPRIYDRTIALRWSWRP